MRHVFLPDFQVKVTVSHDVANSSISDSSDSSSFTNSTERRSARRVRKLRHVPKLGHMSKDEGHSAQGQPEKDAKTPVKKQQQQQEPSVVRDWLPIDGSQSSTLNTQYDIGQSKVRRINEITSG